MKFSQYHQTIQKILNPDLPSVSSITDEGRRIVGDIKIGRTAFMDEMGGELPIVRALPNPPSQVGKGIAALAFNPFVTEDQKIDILALFDCLGDHVVVRQELVNAVMTLSSPAITYFLFQSLIDAGIRAGIKHETATKIVSQTIVGSMEVRRQRNVAPSELLTEACSPGGISIESLFTLEKHAGKAALMEAIDSAIKKAEELGQFID